jgi:hypothetical protein
MDLLVEQEKVVAALQGCLVAEVERSATWHPDHPRRIREVAVALGICADKLETLGKDHWSVATD